MNIQDTRTICLRFLHNRKSYRISLNLAVNEKSWDPAGQKVRGKNAEAVKANTIISKYKARAEQIIFDYLKTGQILTYERFKTELQAEQVSGSFTDFTRNEIELLKQSFAPGTIKTYNDLLSKLIAFQSNILFAEIDYSFLQRYENFLIGSRGNNKNTIAKSLSFIRTMINKAIEKGIIKENPFDRYKIGRIEGNREFLTLDELQQLERLIGSGKLDRSRENVLRYFLFACYTGLRYSDLKNLRFKDIPDRKKINLVMHKTKKPVLIPLSDRAIKFLPDDPGLQNRKVFRVLSNQPSNRHLKDIMKAAGISKYISMHCARHTFGTCAQDLGMSLEVISEIMGHTDIKTTRIYSRIREGRKFQEMEKWNKKEAQNDAPPKK
jgi:site-specific recombinase XerD